MKHCLLKTILLALLTFAGQEVFAYDCYVGGICYDLDDTNRTASVTFKDQTLNSYSGAVTIPESITYNKKPYFVTSIGNDAFHFCSGLISIEIPNSVTTIGGRAFAFCQWLFTITIGNSVTSIGINAFSYCTGLTEIVCLIEEPSTLGDGCWEKVNKDIPLYVPNGKKGLYEMARGWSQFHNIIEMEQTGINVTHNEDFIIHNSANNTYDLQGRKVRPQKKGIYVVNGKKVAVK